MLSICLALLISIPCTLITIVIFCYHKHKTHDDSSTDLSSSASSSYSSVHIPHPHPHHHHHHPHRHVHSPQRSHYAGAYRSPPPPYFISDQPENLFVTPSLPPPYESDSIVNETRTQIPTTTTTTVINVEPAESNETLSSIHPVSQLPQALDAASLLTSASLQTFQA